MKNRPKEALSESIVWLFLFYLTPAFFRILMTLFRFEREMRAGNYNGVFPSRELIAKNADCSVDRVKQFNQYCSKLGKGELVSVTQRFNFKTRKYKSNTYRMHDKLFEMLFRLDGLGLLKNWKKHRSYLHTQLLEDEAFILKKWERYKHPITRGNPSKLPDNKDSLKKEVKNIVHTESAHSSLIFNFGLNSKTLHIAEYYCTKQAVIDARSDYVWYSNNGNTVKNKDALMIHLLKRQSQRHHKWVEKVFINKRF